MPRVSGGLAAEGSDLNELLLRTLTGILLIAAALLAAELRLVTVLNWTRAAGIDLGKWPALKEYRDRVRKRPAVVAAMEAEGMIRKAS